MAQENSNIRVKISTDINEPGQYNVVFHNDDFTPMDFVTMILELIFFKSETEAVRLMLKVHHEGKAIVGTYSYDIAVTKATEANNAARNNGFPLRVTVSEA